MTKIRCSKQFCGETFTQINLRASTALNTAAGMPVPKGEDAPRGKTAHASRRLLSRLSTWNTAYRAYSLQRAQHVRLFRRNLKSFPCGLDISPCQPGVEFQSSSLGSSQGLWLRAADYALMTVGADGDEVCWFPKQLGLTPMRAYVMANKVCFIGNNLFAFGTPEIFAREYEFAQLLPRLGYVPLPGWIAFAGRTGDDRR